jgi:antitoxin component YwqK of YwqJK toxin-antitoxin module
MLNLRSLVLLAVIATAVFLGTVYAWVESSPLSSETVRERYPNRAIKIERHIAQDEKQNFINHGPWTMWDPSGNVIAKGTYQQGLRSGEWKRWHFPSEAKDGVAQASTTEVTDVLNTADFEGFKRPYLSQASFTEDKISGPWTLADAEGKNMLSVDLDKNVLNGKATWWHATGKKRREIDFRNGSVEGEWKEWDATGKTLRADRFLDGSRLAEATVNYDSGAKAAAGVYLHPKESLKVDLDWWIGLVGLNVVAADGKPQKQGRWQFWFEDGEIKCEGEFLDDKPIGNHVWWFANGQKQCEGAYADGQPEGVWVHWHDNGIRAAQGEYKDGKRVGRWMQWDSDGKVASVANQPEPTVYGGRVQSAAQPIPATTGTAGGHVGSSATGTATTGENCVNCRPGQVVRRYPHYPSQPKRTVTQPNDLPQSQGTLPPHNPPQNARTPGATTR